MCSIVNEDDLVENPTARVPVCLCLDTSGSMDGDPINELNSGVCHFYEEIKADETAMYSAEISIVAFGGNGAECIKDFATLDVNESAPVLDCDGGTPMGEAVNMALDMLEVRKQQYKDAGVDYYQPWLVLMTDGMPNGDESELSRAIQRTDEMVQDKKLVVFPIGIGDEADMDTLLQFSPKRKPVRLQGLKFKEFFAWLSRSVAKTSQSIPGESVPLDPIAGWAEVL